MSEISDELKALIAQLATRGGETPEGELPAAWSDVVESGLVGIGIPEESGGSGGDLDDLMLVAHELARHAIPTPFVEAAATSLCGDSVGETFGTIVVQPRGLSIVADGTLSGVVTAPWGTHAARLIVVEPDAVWQIDLEHPSVQRRPQPDIAGQPTAEVTLVSAPAVGVDVDPDAMRARLALLRSAALLGAGRGAFELTRGYVAGREQFGAPLIRLPAVAATVARMSTELLQAEAAVERAAVILGDPASDAAARGAAAGVARISASVMATAIARDAHQLHGAMGVAEEYPLHRFTRALWAWRDLDESEVHLAGRLGALAAGADESVLWDLLTA